MAEEPVARRLTARDLVLIAVLAGATGFIGGFIGGLMTGDIHVYVDSFTGPGHVAATPNTD